MASSRPETGRPVARPIPGASWRARVHDAGEITAQLNVLWRRYAEARDARDFSAADRLLDELAAAGWEMRDEAGGYRLVPRG